jgi:hypothetical protein
VNAQTQSSKARCATDWILKLGVSMDIGAWNLELSRRLANSLSRKPSIALIFAFLILPASQNSEE